ncbi:MAG: putative AraC family transcriptional regulator [Verrucomicrobia bacterium]|nr:putative AraC family transcriptional regulator [Verrucomicrobiota bacterium]
MACSNVTLAWPRAGTPSLRNGGRFPMPPHNPGLVYMSPATVALHVYDYSGKMWLGRRLIRLQPGDFTLTPAGLRSNYDLDEGGYHWCVHFEAQPAGVSPFRLPLHWRPGPHGQRISERLQEIIHLRRLGAGGGADAKLAQQAAGAALQSLLLWIAVTVGSRRSTVTAAPTRVDQALDVARHYLDELGNGSLDVPALARRVGVSQNHLSRRFRAKHGMTMQRYLLGRRIELARHLLEVTRLPLKTVAIESGLGNPQYFHRQFHLTTGHSPSEERKLPR